MDLGFVAGFFQWVIDIVVELWPFKLVRAYQIGARMRAGGIPKIYKPGWVFVMPRLDDFMVMCPLPQWVDCPDQVITTADGFSVFVSGSIYFEVVDYFRYVMKVQDTENSIVAMIMACQAGYISTANYEDITVAWVRKSVIRKIRRESEKWGIRIDNYAVNQLAKIGDGVYWHAGDGLKLEVGDG